MITVPFNNMRTLKFKTQLTNAFFATVNQMYGGGQLPTTAERAVIKSLEPISRLYVLVWTKKQFENEDFRKQLCYDNHNISLPELTANCCAFNFSGAVRTEKHYTSFLLHGIYEHFTRVKTNITLMGLKFYTEVFLFFLRLNYLLLQNFNHYWAWITAWLKFSM